MKKYTQLQTLVIENGITVSANASILAEYYALHAETSHEKQIYTLKGIELVSILLSESVKEERPDDEYCQGVLDKLYFANRYLLLKFEEFGLPH